MAARRVWDKTHPHDPQALNNGIIEEYPTIKGTIVQPVKIGDMLPHLEAQTDITLASRFLLKVQAAATLLALFGFITFRLRRDFIHAEYVIS